MKSLFFNLLFLTFCTTLTVSADTGGPSDRNINGIKNTNKIKPANNENAEAATVNLNFKVIKRGGQVDFFWVTPFTGAAQGFVVQFSEDGKKYYDISTVETEKVEVGDIFYDSYFVPYNIKNYYRIELINVDGSISYTKTVLK
ncbi:MAG TPA: hypothetical protein ENJ95_05580 [Bacteroidetes bacterium]|nr:hypothetical protein [Bacteroidota bacterium]